MEIGKYYHIYNRGNNKENIFFELKNYEYFLKKFCYYLEKYVDIYAYCLMPNHFHFLIQVKETLSDTQIKYSSNLTIIEKAFRDFFMGLD